MYVGKVLLKNIRGFETLDFDLERPDGSHAGWTVFTGDNGSGKSALMKAIAIGLAGRDTTRSLQPSLHRWIRHGAQPSEGAIQLVIVGRDGDDALVEKGNTPKSAFPARLVLRNGGKDVTLSSEIPEGWPTNYKSPERSI